MGRHKRRSDACLHLIKRQDRPGGARAVDAAARAMVTRVRPHAYGDIWKIDTWLDTAKSMGIQVQAFKSGEMVPGFCHGHEEPVIFYNVDYPEVLQCKAFVHELGHALAKMWKDSPFPKYNVENYDGFNSPQHKMANRFEYLILHLEVLGRFAGHRMKRSKNSLQDSTDFDGTQSNEQAHI